MATDRGRAGVERLTTETKQAFKTTEFWAMVALIVGILMASAVIGDSDDDNGAGNVRLDGRLPCGACVVVRLIVGAAYIVSRGLAKAGSRDPYWADRADRPRPDDDDDRARNVRAN